MGLFSPDNVSFYSGLGIIVTTNPYTHVYGVAPYPDTAGVLPIPSIDTGALGNSVFGVQIHRTYAVGDIVLFFYQQNYGANGVTPIGYIVGLAPLNTILTSQTSELVRASEWDGDNLTFREFPLFSNLTTSQSADPAPRQMIGHGASDMLPGDIEAAGRLISLLLGDYFAGFKGTGAEFLVSGLDRRILLRSFLRTESTVNSLKDIAVYNRSTITTEKTTGNVDDAWYDYLEEADGEIRVAEGGLPPTYRTITQSGDILYGRHQTILSGDKETPLYSNYEGLDGTKSVYAATRFSIGKKPGIKYIEYTGDRFCSEDQSGFEPTPELIGDPLKNLNVDSENWKVYEDDLLFAMNGYPAEFLEDNLGEYPDKDPVEVFDPLRRNESIKIYPGIGNIDFLEDGSIRIRDAWGSYILLSHGNIELHAVNNLFAISARDTIAIAGGNRTTYAEHDLSLQARTGDLRQLGGKNVRIQSGDQDKNGETIIESKNRIQLMSKELYMDAIYVGVTCKDPWTDGGKAGTFQVLAPTGHIRMRSSSLRLNGDYLSLTGQNTALVLAGTAALAGNITILGGIHCVQKDISIKVLRDAGKLEEQTFSAGSSVDIINENGGIRARGRLCVDGMIWASGQIIGDNILVLNAQEKLIPAMYPDKVRSTVQNVPKATLPPDKTKADDNSVAALQPRDTAALSFSFGKPSQACVYRLTTPIPTKNANRAANSGYTDNRGRPQYIYPGEEFWVERGILDITVPGKVSTYGFNALPKAQINNK